MDEIKLLKNLKKKIKDKSLQSLRLKPLETLILLNKLLMLSNDYNISNDNLTRVNKYYFLVSETTPINEENIIKNKSRRRCITKKEKNTFEFIYRYNLFPFIATDYITEETFLKLITTELFVNDL